MSLMILSSAVLISLTLLPFLLLFFFFFFNDTATTEIYTLSLHDALPISSSPRWSRSARWWCSCASGARPTRCARSEEHTSELQSQFHLVCRLLLEKKKNNKLGLSIF